jgi:hypothetical protein
MSLVALGLGMAGLVSAGHAIAGCSGYTPPALAPTFRQAPLSEGFQDAVFRPGQGGMIRVSDDRGVAVGGIVGLWRFKMTSDGTAHPGPIPYGATVDFGTQQWHSDGTEIMVSGGRAPSTGDVCMGAWEKTGHRTYKLKHIGLSYGGDPLKFVGPAIIGETVVLSHSGNSFEGKFTIDQYAEDEVTLLEHISGTVSGTRVTVD